MRHRKPQETFTPSNMRAWEATIGRWASGVLEDEPESEKPKKPRKQSEATEQAELTRIARKRWWGPGYRHQPQETISAKEARARWRAGRTSGLVDVRLWIPAVDVHRPQGHRLPVRALLELKRDDPKIRPAKPKPEWWLHWRPDIDHLKNEPKSHGLMWSQAKELQLAHAVGYETFVAYGAAEAIAWLDEIAGPEPAVLPEGWGR